MVMVNVSKHARINRQKTKEMINNVFGHPMTHRKVTRALDDDGQLSAISNTDTVFTGDLQSGPDLSRKYISTGIVNVGDAVVYMAHDALSTLPVAEDFIIDGSDQWEIIERIKSPSLGGTIAGGDVTHYEFRCKRKLTSTNN